MLAYRYDEETKYYVDQQECQLDPLETKIAGHDVWLLPANCTFIAPIEPQEGYNVKWNGTNWEYESVPAPPEPEPPTLDEAKELKINELKYVRDAKEVEPVQTTKGMFDYDDKSRDRLQIARQSLEDNPSVESIVWTTADNQRVPLSVADFAEINSVAAYRSNQLHIKYNELKEEVNACETVEEVEAIVWTE